MKHWYFAYGPSTSPEAFKARYEVEEFQPASLEDFRFVFAVTRDTGGAGTSCIVPSVGDVVLGVAYLVDEETLREICAADSTKGTVLKQIRVKGCLETAHLVVSNRVGGAAPPEDSYLARVREGLTYFYPVTVVDSYLRKALGRQSLFSDLLIQRLDGAVVNREYGCDFRRLYPWKGVVRTSSWGCAVGVLRPGESTTPHSHDEEETALILSGTGEIDLEGRTARLSGGDVVFHPPDATHTIRNISETDDLQVLFIWWGGREVEQSERLRLSSTA